MEQALAAGAGAGAGAGLVWLMDDDGRPAEPDCLPRLVTLAATGVRIAAPLVLDEDQPERLAFRLRLGGQMLDMPRPTRLYEAGARMTWAGCTWHPYSTTCRWTVTARWTG